MPNVSSHRNCSSPRNKQILFNRTKRTYCIKLYSCEINLFNVIFLWGYVSVRLSSCKVSSFKVVAHTYLPVRLSNHEVFFLLGCWAVKAYLYEVRSSFYEVVFRLGHIPVRLPSFELIFLWGCLHSKQSSYEVV